MTEVQAKIRAPIKKVALVTTTINVPLVLKGYVLDHKLDSSINAELDVIVAGDVQTPREARDCVQAIGGTYIGVDDTKATRWQSNEFVSARSIQRRNIAILHAIATGADLIISVDDDNEPNHGYIRRMFDEFTPKINTIAHSKSGWYNTCSALSPATWARGFPIPYRSATADNGFMSYEEKWIDNVGVVQGLTIGDPDVDAFERIANRPFVEATTLNENVVLDYETWAPFNTQNTGIIRELSPLLHCMVGVGRYDDILSSYIARAIMNVNRWRVSYGHPVTTSERNEHDLLTDLERELLGYRIVPEFVDRLQAADDILPHDDIINQLGSAYDAISDLVPKYTRFALDAWLDDVVVALQEGDHG